MGLNIYGANRVVIFDFQHSPVHEQQAIGRAYRIGQTKPVVVYWLICDGTFEKTLHNQQVFKNQLASRVVDKKNPLPKATSMRQYFTEPQQVEHQDTVTAAYLGRDVILDTLLTSNEIREGISSISTTETFEEEDTQKLEAEEIALANQLVEQQISRRNNPTEEIPVGIMKPPEPSEQVREIPTFFLTSSVNSPLTFLRPTPTADSNSGTTALPVPGQLIASTIPNPRAESLLLSNVDSENGGGQHRTQSLPSESQPFLASSPANFELTAVADANSLTQMAPTTLVPSGFPMRMWRHQHGSHQTDVITPDLNDLAPRVLARDDDPFTDFDPRNQHGVAGAQSLARTATEPSITPVTMNNAQGRSAQLAANHSGRPTVVPQDMLPVAIGGGQTVSRESMKPIGLGAMMTRPVAPGTRDNGMGDFRDELTMHASAPLIPQVPATVERINKHIKGGGFVRTSTWAKLKALVRGSRDRADRIINGVVSAQTLATAGDPRAALEDLLDGRSSAPVTQSQDDRRMKDPDVGNPSDIFDS